jgi:hypothetical protein
MAAILHAEARLRTDRLCWVVMVALLPALAGAAPQTSDSATTLQQTRDRLLADLSGLPRYTCTQSITRKYFRAPAGQKGWPCGALIAAHDSRERELPMQGWDRLRLEVTVIDRGDVFSWVGASRFDENAFERFAGDGPLGSGDYGTFLSQILDRATMKFEREVVIDGHRVLEFSYEMPPGVSRYKVKTDGGWAFTAYSGNFHLDADAKDIVSLTIRTSETPDGSLACQLSSEVVYGRTAIHDRMILIPRETRLRAIYRNGAETLSQTNYTSCREYSSTGRMLSEAPQNTVKAKAAPPPAVELPMGFRFEIRTVTPIDSDTAWGGDPLEAILRSPIRDEKHHVLVPAGARVHGRLVRMEQQFEPDRVFRIGMQLESIEISGQFVPLKAGPLESIEIKRVDAGPSGVENREPIVTYQGNWGATIGVFTFPVKHLQLNHHDSEWVITAAR